MVGPRQILDQFPAYYESGFAFCVSTRPLSVVVQREQPTDPRYHAGQVLDEEGVLDHNPHP